MKVYSLHPVKAHPDIVMDAYIPEIITHHHERVQMPAMLIIPGGAYKFHSPNECEQTAIRFCGAGYASFVLRYSVDRDADFPKPLIDASDALWFIRSHAEEYSIHPNRIAIMGFSAGAHLASALCTMWHYEELQHDDMPFGGNRPDASVFGYLPTTFEDMYEKMKDKPGFKLHVLGESGRFADITSLTTDNKIDSRTPPAFLWKTIKQVPESTFKYADGLKAAGVPYEVHVFTESSIVTGTMDGYTCAKNTKMWVTLALNWLDIIFGIEEKAFEG